MTVDNDEPLKTYEQELVWFSFEFRIRVKTRGQKETNAHLTPLPIALLARRLLLSSNQKRPVLMVKKQSVSKALEKIKSASSSGQVQSGLVFRDD